MSTAVTKVMDEARKGERIAMAALAMGVFVGAFLFKQQSFFVHRKFDVLIAYNTAFEAKVPAAMFLSEMWNSEHIFIVPVIVQQLCRNGAFQLVASLPPTSQKMQTVHKFKTIYSPFP